MEFVFVEGSTYKTKLKSGEKTYNTSVKIEIDGIANIYFESHKGERFVASEIEPIGKLTDEVKHIIEDFERHRDCIEDQISYCLFQLIQKDRKRRGIVPRPSLPNHREIMHTDQCGEIIADIPMILCEFCGTPRPMIETQKFFGLTEYECLDFECRRKTPLTSEEEKIVKGK